MEEYFKADQVNDIKDKKPNLAATQLRGLKLGTFLDMVLLSMNATFIVRPDYIEITTFDRRLEEKVTRVFPVADLVIPDPQLGQPTDAVAEPEHPEPAVGDLRSGTRRAKLPGIRGCVRWRPGRRPVRRRPVRRRCRAIRQGGQGGQQFGPAPGGGNQGFGQGGLGVGGGQLGQFGNLGGQFGLQGGDQSRLLMNLIVETVARGEWLQRAPPRPAAHG